jgi:hypothetical protein
MAKEWQSRSLYSQKMDGEAYLRRLTESWLQEIGQAPEKTRELVSGLRLQEIEAAGRALVAAGAISNDRLGLLLRELRQFLLDRGIIREVHASMEADLGLVVAERDPNAPPPKEWAQALDGAHPELRRVIPVAQDLGPVNDGNRVLIISIEAWSDRFALRYASSEGSSRDHRGFPRVGSLLWDASDDVGTPYRQGGGGGGGGRPWFIFTADFFPGIPAEAKELTLVAKPFASDQELSRMSILLT